jgi:hypothetical protein
MYEVKKNEKIAEERRRKTRIQREAAIKRLKEYNCTWYYPKPIVMNE